MRIHHAVTMILLLLAFPVFAQETPTPPPMAVVSINTAPPPTITGVTRVTLTLVYTGGYYLYGATLGLVPCSGSVISQNPVYLGWLSPGQQFTATYLLNVTLPVNCQSTLTLSWNYQLEQAPGAKVPVYIQVGGSGSSSITIPLVIHGEPLLSIHLGTHYLVSNLDNPINLTISNNGSGPIYNLRLSLNIQGASLSSGTGTYYVGNLEPGDNRTINIHLVPITQEPVVITINYYGIDQGGDSLSDSSIFTLPVSPASSSQVIVVSTNSSLRMGTGKLVLSIRNMNPVPIYNVTFSILSMTGLSLISNMTYSTGELLPGASWTLNIPVAIPTTSSSASITYSIVYQYPGGYPSSTTGSMSMMVLNYPDVSVISYQVAPIPVTVGSTGSISISLVNTGPVPAYNLNITAIPSPGVEFLSQRSTYMGTINPQQLSAAAFGFIANQPGNTTITLLVQYMDQFGQRYSKHYTVSITVVSNVTSTTVRPRGPSLSYPVIAVATIAAIAIALTTVLTRRVHNR